MINLLLKIVYYIVYKITISFDFYFYGSVLYVYYRSELWGHLFFDDCLNFLNFNSVSDKICSLNELNSIKILYKMSPE